jgi:hypothetical protein
MLLKYFDVGFWLKEASYKEQPEVHFKHQFVVFLQGLTSDSYVAYSTYQNFNNLVNDKLRIPVTKVVYCFYICEGLPVIVSCQRNCVGVCNIIVRN